MARFCPTSWIALGSAFVLVGCSGQNLEGAWRGPLPLKDGSDCRIRLHGDGTVDLACKGRLQWIGAGRWTRDGDKLALTWSILGQPEDQKAAPGPPMTFRFVGHGNSMSLRDEVGAYEWKRLW